jgi:hypothetical protein
MGKQCSNICKFPSVPSHRITHAHHRGHSAAEAIFANGTYFLDNPHIFCKLTVMNMVTKKNFDVISNQINIYRICT